MFYLSSAHKWLELAQRQDLMTKPLNTIIKYFLCSEHFTDDCFVDPQSRSRLKRSVRPFFAPLPSIFKSNIEQYIRTNKPLANTDQHGNEVDADSLAKTADIYQHFIANSIRKEDDEEQDENDFIYVTPIEDDVNVEEAAEGDNDGQNYIIHDGSSQDQVVVRNLNFASESSAYLILSDQDEDDKNEELQDEIIVLVEEQETEMELDHAEAKERLMNDATCRLCAKVFAVDDGLMRIFGSDQSIHEDLQLLLNDVVRFKLITNRITS